MLLYVNHTISYENFHLTNLIIIKLNSKCFLEKNSNLSILFRFMLNLYFTIIKKENFLYI